MSTPTAHPTFDAPRSTAPDGTTRRRLFVCDPVCVQPYGHNVSALHYFRSAFADLFDESTGLCCIDLPGAVSAQYRFEPFYRYCYQAFMPVPALTPPTPVGASGRLFNDGLEAVATEDAARLLAAHRVSRADTLFFPSLDFYGVAGLLNALHDLPVQQQPRVFLRFIGVMESASHSYRDPQRELYARIRRSHRHGVRISVSAETPRLSDRLAIELRMPVGVTPYPAIAEATPIPDTGPFICFCPGSARFDKGFLHLRELFAGVRERDPGLSIRFVIQDLPARQAAPYQSYVSALYAIPGLELLPAQISEAEMIASYRASSVVLLPYDREVYELRGSAAMMEAVCFGRPVLALDGPAFTDQIRYYKLGQVVSSIADMRDAVLALKEMEPGDLTLRAMQGRFRFTSDASDAYRRWFKEAP